MPKAEIGRLAFRQEGAWWNAYWAPRQDTMDGAVLMGTVRIHLAKGNAKAGFMLAMQEAFDVACKDVTGETPVWGDERAAPESERSGHA
jgi:hypothetical protein